MSDEIFVTQFRKKDSGEPWKNDITHSDDKEAEQRHIQWLANINPKTEFRLGIYIPAERVEKLADILRRVVSFHATAPSMRSTEEWCTILADAGAALAEFGEEGEQ